MTNLVNLQRDQLWLPDANTSLTWPTVSNGANSDGVVYQDVGMAYIWATTDASATNARCGVMMQQPTGENTPYRVKIYSNQNVYVMFAYCTTTTGTNDTIYKQKGLHIAGTQGEVFDEVVNIEASSGSDPLFIGVQALSTSQFINAVISVQRLNVATPTFASTVS
jgi:hypothetical protein